MSIEELQKALDTFQKEYNDYLELTEKVLPGQPKEVREFVLSMLESLTLYNLFINRVKTGLSVFKSEYDEQLHVPRFSICMSNEDYDRMVHLSRKQLSDLSKRLHDDLIWNENDLPYDIEDAEDLKDLIKELLSASEHHFLTVGEAREKLKETSK